MGGGCLSCTCPASTTAQRPFLPELRLPSCLGSTSLPARAQLLFLPGLSFSSCLDSASLPARAQPPFLPGLNLSSYQSSASLPARPQPLFLPELNFPSCLSSLTLPSLCPVRLCQAFAEGKVPLIKIIWMSSLNLNPGAIKAYMPSPGHLGAAVGWESLN